MRKFRLLPLFFLLFVAVSTPSCSKKSGCPATASLEPQKNRKGEYKKGKKSSGLFPKKMAKRMR